MAQETHPPGWKSVIDWFGFAPTFHDAEIISVELRREPELSMLKLAFWRTSEEVTETGTYKQDRHATVVFEIGGIEELRLDGWSRQNVIDELTVEQTRTGFRLVFPQIYGVDGAISARHIVVRIEPAII
jgi:hypothetical protein